MNILITGAAGYIGSHIALNLIEQNKKIFLIDNLENSSINNINVLRKLYKKKINFTKLDVRDEKKLSIYLKRNKITDIIHLAGLKSVEESEIYPEKYYENNIVGIISILKSMNYAKTKNIIFSSSATVYGDGKRNKINEKNLVGYKNSYGLTKLISEDLIKNFCKKKKIKSVILRYFNPVGSHKNFLIGDDPLQPRNLMPILNKSAFTKEKKIFIYGNDYKTKDGTAVRDYIHISDLASSHTECLKILNKIKNFEILNVGTGKPYSVLQIVKCYEKVNNIKFNIIYKKRRKGDAPILFADNSKILKKTKWRPKHNIEEMCSSAHKFKRKKLLRQNHQRKTT